MGRIGSNSASELTLTNAMENTHRFNSPLARDLFALGASTMQEQLAEAWEGVPESETRLTPEEVNRLAAEWDERKSEGRMMRPYRVNFKE